MYIGAGIALGLTFGVVLWLATDNVAFLGAGLPIGIAVGAGLDANEKRKADENDRDDEPDGD